MIKRVVFMGTPDFSVPILRAIHEHYDVVAVYTQPDREVGRGKKLSPPPVKIEALKLNLDVNQPASLKDESEIEKLRKLKPDVIVVVAYGQILKQSVLDLPPFGCINIHSSLLPRWRGAAPIQWAILEGDDYSGITTMKMVKKLDAGAILEEKSTKLLPGDTAQSLHDRLSEMGATLILSTLQGLDEGSLKEVPQQEVDDQGNSRVTYAQKLTKEMEWLDPDKTAIEIDRQIRALTPWPGTSVKIKLGEKKNRLKIIEAEFSEDLIAKKGKIELNDGKILLGTSKGAICLKQVQLEGKRPSDALAFINGLKGQGIDFPLQWEKGSA